MASYNKTIGSENIFINEVWDKSEFYTIPGSAITVYELLPKSDPNFTLNPTSHLWGASLGIYNNQIANMYDTSYKDGGFLGTALDGIYDAYTSNGAIFISIGDNYYRKSINGNDLAFKIPITGGTGDLSGLTAVTVYSTFFNQPGLLDVDRTSKCKKAKADCMRFETFYDVTANGIGAAREPGNTGMDYQGCISYLFADELSFTTGSTTGNSFTTGHMATSPYGVGGKYLADYINDKAVGVFNGCNGTVFLWNSQIVDTFDFASALSGTTGSTGYVFSDNVLYGNVTDWDTSQEINIKIVAEPGEFVDSNNPSIEQATLDGQPCDDSNKYVTSICLMDAGGRTTGYLTVDEEYEKNKDGYLVFNANAALDGGILDNIFPLLYST